MHLLPQWSSGRVIEFCCGIEWHLNNCHIHLIVCIFPTSKRWANTMVEQQIPFNRVTLTGNEFPYMQQSMAEGRISGDGAFTKKCHTLLEETIGAKKALLATSCTHALEMVAMLLNIEPGDEVILPSFTFVSTVNAFVLRGAKPIFADIRPDTLNIDEVQVATLITPRTRAIVAVHYAGIACEMDALIALANQHNITLIEDNAHGLFGAYKGKPLGTFGAFSTQSFHETKNITCGEGGALLINDAAMIERAEIIREKGTNRSRFFRGQVDKYTWVDIGSSYLPSDILAAFLYAQLEQHQHIQAERKRVWDTYHALLSEWAPNNGIQLPTVPAHVDQSYHLYYILLPSLEARTHLIDQLLEQGIKAVFHYLPLNLSDMGRELGGYDGQCPVTEDVSDRLLRLPFYNTLTEGEITRVAGAIKQIVTGQMV